MWYRKNYKVYKVFLKKPNKTKIIAIKTDFLSTNKQGFIRRPVIK